jgi:hypothetical protein
MRPFDDSSLTPDERRSEVARLLAAGVLRLHAWKQRAADPACDSASENPSESASSYLEVPAETVLSVHNG